MPMHSYRRQPKHQQGFALVTVMIMVVVLSALLMSYFFITNVEVTTTRSTRDRTTGFFAAEAGLNLRAEAVRDIFEGFDRPQGGDLAEETFTLNDRTVRTWLEEDPSNGVAGNFRPVNQGPFAGLFASHYRYDVFSDATQPDGTLEAQLEMTFNVQLIPIFQFAAFYDKDLEINPGPRMDLEGPIHTNGNLYLRPGATLNVGSNDPDSTGRISVSRRPDPSPSCGGSTGVACTDAGGRLFRQRKDNNQGGGRVNVRGINLIGAGEILQDDIPDNLQQHITIDGRPLRLPPLEDFERDGEYWRDAQLRIVLQNNNNIQVMNVDGTVNTPATTALTQLCHADGFVMDTNNPTDREEWRDNEFTEDDVVGAPVLTPYTGHDPTVEALAELPGTHPVEWSNGSFRDNREGNGSANRRELRILEIDLRGLLSCIADRPNVFGFELDDNVEGGLVFYFTVAGPRKDLNTNNYAVRIRNGSEIAPSFPGASFPRLEDDGSGTGARSNQAQLQGFNADDFYRTNNNNDFINGSDNRPEIRGLTIVSDEAIFVQGDYNVDNWRPAAFMGDTFNVLSNTYSCRAEEEAIGNIGTCIVPRRAPEDASGWDATARGNASNVAAGAVPLPTTIQAAVIAGTDTTGRQEGEGGRGGGYNGGLENYPRFHEDWNNVIFTYVGSLVSLGQPQRAFGAWGIGGVYSAPTRDWTFDERFRDAANNMPPKTPRATDLSQEVFVREFERRND